MVGKFRNIGLGLLLSLSIGGPMAVVADDSATAGKKQEAAASEVKKEEPWRQQIVYNLEEYNSGLEPAEKLILFLTDREVNARALIKNKNYTFRERECGIEAIISSPEKIIILNNRDKKDGFESVYSINPTNTNFPETLYEFDPNADPYSKKSGIEAWTRREKEIQKLLLVDIAREAKEEFFEIAQAVDFRRYTSMLRNISARERYHVGPIKFKEDACVAIIQVPGLSGVTNIVEYVDELVQIEEKFKTEEKKECIRPSNILFEYAALRTNEIVVFRALQEEQGEAYNLFVHTENHGLKGLHCHMDSKGIITIKKTFAREEEIAEEDIIKAEIIYKPNLPYKPAGGEFNFQNISLDSAKELFDFIHPLFERMLGIYKKNKRRY